MRRLLVGLFLDAIDVPIMRKWYFPSQRKAMLVVVGDQDGADFEQLKVVLGMMKELGTPYTLYVTPADQPMTKEQFKVLAEGGMEFALHPDFVSPGRKFTEQEFDRAGEEGRRRRRLRDDRRANARLPLGIVPRSARRGPKRRDSSTTRFSAPGRGSRSRPRHGYWLGTGLPYHFIDPAKAQTAGLPGNPRCRMRQYGLLEDAASTPWRTSPAPTRRSLSGWALRRMRRSQCGNGSWIGRWTSTIRSAATVGIPFIWPPRNSISPESPHTDTHFRKCIAYAKSRGMGLTGTNALNDFWRAREKGIAVKHVVWNPASATIQYKVPGEVKVSALTFHCAARGSTERRRESP